MKIALYTTSKLNGNILTGGQKRFLELVKACEGEDAVLYSPDENNPQEKYVEFSKLKDCVKFKNVFAPVGLRFIFTNLKKILEMKREKFDKVIVFEVYDALWLALIGIPHLNLLFRQDIIEYRKITYKKYFNNKIKSRLYFFLLRLSESLCIKKSEKIIVQCSYDADNLIKRHRFLADDIKKKIYIQINNVNPSWIMQNHKNIDDDVKTESDFSVFFIGNFNDDRKGQKIFLEVAQKKIDLGYKGKFILIGDGILLDKYKKEYLEYENIIFKGYLKNPFSLLKKTDLLVVPSLSDSCPNTIMEALYNDIAVIGSDCGGIPEILKNPKAMFKYSSEELYKCLTYYTDIKKREELKIQQRERRKELMFDWGSVIMKIIKDD